MLPLPVVCAGVLLSFSSLPPCPIQGPDGWAPEDLRASTTATSSQDAVTLGRDAAGRITVCWQSRRQEEGSYGIRAQRFDATGGRLGGEVAINSTRAGMQTFPTVALAPDGTAWFAWQSFGQDGDAGAVVVRRFEPGMECGGPEWIAHELGDGHQEQASIAVLVDGRAVVAWTTPGADSLERLVRARLFDPDGPLGAELAVTQTGCTQRDSLPTVVAERDGFAVVWSRASGSATRPVFSIVGRRFDGEGRARGPEQELAGEGDPIEPVLAANALGELCLGWMAREGARHVPHVRRARGSPGGSFVLDPVERLATGSGSAGPAGGAGGWISGLTLALDPAGNGLAAWSAFGAEGRSRLIGRVLDGGANPEPLTLSNTGVQRLAVASGTQRAFLDADGGAGVAWSGDAGLGDRSAAHLTLLGPRTPRAAVARATASGLDGDAEELGRASADPHEPPIRGTRPPPSRDRLARDFQPILGGDHGFLGIVDTGWLPPDADLAVGPGHVVMVTNGALASFSREGLLLAQQALEGPAGLWAALGAGAFVFDPEVHFDPASGRFFVLAAERSLGVPYFLLAVSAGGDPTGAWHTWRLDVQALVNDNDIDSPNLALDAAAVYLAADFFNPDVYLVLMLDKATLLAGGAPAQRHVVLPGARSPGLARNKGAAPAQYLLEAHDKAQNTKVVFHAITGAPGSPSVASQPLTVPTYEAPEDAPQLGTTLRSETFEPRFWSCVWSNGSLWATHHVGASRVLQRWYEFDLRGWPQSGSNPVLVQTGEIDLGAGVRTCFGAIQVDGAGNAGLVFARTSPTEFYSIVRALRLAGDPPGTMPQVRTLQTSIAPDLTGRWGDYGGLVEDPRAPGAFWSAHQFRALGWATWVSVFGVCETPTTYCVAKANSAGRIPAIGYQGRPSLADRNFELTLVDGKGGARGVLIQGTEAAAMPFAGGTLCLRPPLQRAASFFLDSNGAVSVPRPVEVAELGQTTYFQFWYRDGQQMDGTGAGLSDALRATFCP